jgi:hypothetical protein
VGLCRKIAGGFEFFKATIMMLYSELVTRNSYRSYIVENAYSTNFKLSCFVTVIATIMNEAGNGRESVKVYPY